MAGTDQTHKDLPSTAPFAPAIILVEPQLGENIGMCARAMLNCAVTELRIVAPRDGWPNPAAVAAASGAIGVLENAKVFATTQDAVADLEYVFATTARGRDMVKDVYTAEAAAKIIHEKNAARIQKCGILFGRERTGLENEDIAIANAILNIPLNPGFSSLNLAQAVLLVSYSWLSCQNPFATGDIAPTDAENAPATKGAVENLLRHLDEELTTAGFFRSAEQKPTTLRNIRNFFFRGQPTEQEVRTLHGIISSLTGKRSWK